MILPSVLSEASSLVAERQKERVEGRKETKRKKKQMIGRNYVKDTEAKRTK